MSREKDSISGWRTTLGFEYSPPTPYEKVLFQKNTTQFRAPGRVSPSIPSLGGDPDKGEGERTGRSPDLVNRE